MSKPTQAELKEILALHKKWCLGEEGGRCADLRSADLRSADLRSADLRSADLSGSDLRSADLRSADLSGSDLRSADLRSADLSGSYLSGANLSGADLSGANLSPYSIVPSEGSFVGFKAVAGAVLKLEIPADAQRTSSLVGRKCRASKVKVLEVVKNDLGRATEVFLGLRNPACSYKVGEVTEPDSYDPDIRVECTHGIHFFLTQQEAENYNG